MVPGLVNWGPNVILKDMFLFLFLFSQSCLLWWQMSLLVSGSTFWHSSIQKPEETIHAYKGCSKSPRQILPQIYLMGQNSIMWPSLNLPRFWVQIINRDKQETNMGNVRTWNSGVRDPKGEMQGNKAGIIYICKYWNLQNNKNSSPCFWKFQLTFHFLRTDLICCSIKVLVNEIL